jgi:hypothetical protein
MLNANYSALQIPFEFQLSSHIDQDAAGLGKMVQQSRQCGLHLSHISFPAGFPQLPTCRASNRRVKTGMMFTSPGLDIDEALLHGRCSRVPQ